MKFFTKQSGKAVAKRFVLLFLTMLAFGFTANSQIPTFNEILERYYNPQDLVVKATAQTPPYGQQFQNYTFEEWESQKTGGWFSKNFSEPYNWNSFMTADAATGLSLFLSNQIEESSQKRPGSSGSKSARIFSKSTAGVVANGNMTNGRIRAGSTTAESDDNYNYTSRSDANFNTPLTTIPDSLTVWVAFKPKDASKGNARITTTIHGDTDLKQLAKSGDSPANMVCATANVEIAATSTSAVVWKRMSIPFTKGSNNDPRYILATFNTNKTPGGGSDGDELYVDDICLIYKPTLNVGSIAQTEYNITNDLTANIEVTFTLTGSMSVYNLNKAANEVIAQLSDANGSFANPIELGRVTTDVSGTINGVIPAGLLTGKGYRVRVVSTNYPMTSDDNGTNLVINCLSPQVTISKEEVLQKSATIKFTPTEYCAQYYIMAVPASETVDVAYVKANGEVKTGTFTKTFENLVSRTDYAIYALPVGGEGELGKLTKILVKTQSFVPQVDVKRGNFAAKSITATFTPKDDCAEYYFLISTETVDAAYVKANGEKQTAALTKTFENLTSNTAYKIYALPVDVDGFYGELNTLDVTTQALVPQTTVTVGEVATKSATVTFEPKADCVKYYFLITSETVDAAYVKANGEVKTESYTASFENLISNTNYTVYALPIDVEDKEGALTTESFKTQAFVPQINDIGKGLVTAKSITVTFTPTNADCAEYYFMIAPAAETVDAATIKANGEKQTAAFTKTFENLTSNTAYKVYALPVDVDGFYGQVKASDVIKTNALVPTVDVTTSDVLTKSATATFAPNADCVEYYFMIAPATETVDAAKVKEGEKQETELTKTFENLISNTDYVLYVLSVDVEGTESALSTTPIKTQAFAPQVNVERGNVAAKSITMTFTPTNTDCAEYYFLISTETVDAAYIQANGEKQTATFTKIFENLTSNTSYTIYALPVDVDGFYGELKVINVTTKVLVPTVGVTTSDVLTKSATATFAPNEDCLEYYFLITAETVDAAYVKANGEVKTESYTASFDLISNTNYTIYVLPIDIEGNEGSLSTSDTFKTQAFVPQVNNIERGKVLAKSITVTFTPNADCTEYYFMITEDEVVDASIIKANGEKQTSTFTKTFENLTSNTDYTIYALPVDVDGFNGEIKSVTIKTSALKPQVTMTKDEALTYSMTISFAPNEDCLEYYFLKTTATVDAAYVKEHGELKEGAFTKKWEELLPSTNYTVFVLPIDIEDKEGNLNTLVVKTRAEAGVSEVDIDIEKLSYTSAAITATPNENTVLYHYIVIEKEEADAMGEDALMQRLNENVNYIDSIVVVDTMAVESNVAYYVVAQGKNRDDKWGEIAIKEFTVSGPAVVEVAVEKLNETSVEVTATPNSNTALYQYIVIEKAEFDTLSAEALAQRLEAANDLDSVDTWTYTVKSNVEYYVVAQGKNADGFIGEMTQVEFVVAGPATVAVAVEKLNETTVNVAATPNENAVEYSYIIIAKAEADEMDEASLKQMIVDSENLFKAANTKEHTIESNVAYYVIAQAVNADDMSGVITKVEFTVAGPAAVEIAVEKLTETTVNVTATPNENTDTYHYIVIEKAVADTMSEAALLQRLEVSNELDEEETWTYTVKSNVEYYVIAQAVNTDGMTGEMTQVEFTVAGPATVAIAVEKLNETTVSVAATPNENAVSYGYVIIAKAEADAMTSEEIAERLNASENVFEAAGTKEHTIESNVAYYVIAQAVNADDMSGVITKVEFTVAGPAAVEIAVEKLTETTVSVTATPNENTVSYHYIVIEKAEADTMSEAALLQRLEASNELKEGETWTYTVKSNVEYYVIAQGKNADDMVGEMTQVEFTVAGPATIAIAVEELSDTTVSVVATPNENAVAYHYIVIEKAEADSIGEDALMQRLAENENYLEGANTAELTIESNVAYYVVAQAKNADGRFGVVTKVEFIVEVAGPATVAIAVEELSKTSVSVTATPNENTVAYHYIIIAKAEADSIGEEALMQRLAENENYLKNVDVCTWPIESNVAYYVVAQAKNADDRWGEVTKVEFIVEEAGPATVAIAVEKVSDSLVAIVATPNENAVAYHYIVIEKADADTIGEDALMQRLAENENYLEGVDTTEYVIEANVEYYVVAQAVNADSVFGEVTMVEFVITEDNPGDDNSVEEFNKLAFEIYPNPAIEYVRIKANSEIESLVIYSIDGKVVYSEDVNQEETMINVAGFAKGSYLVKMLTNGEVVVKRIIVK